MNLSASSAGNENSLDFGTRGSKDHLETLIVDDLKALGLTERESEVYIGLSKRKIMKAGDLSRQVGLHKAQVYHILKSLQDKGLVDSTLEVPARFTAVPLEKVLSLSIKAKIEDAKYLENSRDEVLSRRVYPHGCNGHADIVLARPQAARAPRLANAGRVPGRLGFDPGVEHLADVHVATDPDIVDREVQSSLVDDGVLRNRREVEPQ